MPRVYSEDFKREAVEKAHQIGVPAAAHDMGTLQQNVRNWLRQERLRSTKPVPEKFSPAFKETVVEYARNHTTANTAREFDISIDSVRRWIRLHNSFGSASAPDPWHNRERASKEPVTAHQEPRETITADDWLRAVYEIYARDSQEGGFDKFKERIEKYSALILEEKKHE